MKNLKPNDWNTILSALWLASQKVTTEGERQQYLKVYGKVRQRAEKLKKEVDEIIERMK